MNRPIAQVCYFGGFRISEVLSLTWADIKFGSDDGEGFLINIREGKTQKSLLPVESLPELREILNTSLREAG